MNVKLGASAIHEFGTLETQSALWPLCLTVVRAVPVIGVAGGASHRSGRGGCRVRQHSASVMTADRMSIVQNADCFAPVSPRG
ncbi:hypothetical protein, partial [Nonomuraea sp. LPB2021202275-12-8]|uniref:hypothetical protein n=1 Tax=Nonomuraea sp. LPB2021202275-12-8 TaxID=3120159 RepID=UPI00300DAB25